MKNTNVLVVGNRNHDQVSVVANKVAQCGGDVSFVDYSSDTSCQFNMSERRIEVAGTEVRPDVIWAADKYLVAPYGRDDHWALNYTKQAEWRSANRNMLFYFGDIVRNPAASIYFEYRKIEQVSVAERCGFSVPHWRLTNSIEALMLLLNEGRELIFKPIGERCVPIYHKSGELRSFWPRPKRLDLKALEAITQHRIDSPIFVQQRISRYYEVRSIVIGKRIYYFKIQYLKDTDLQDRLFYDHPDCIIEEASFPALERPIIEFMRTFNLHYGHFDFIVDTDGGVFFLECNPNGVWLNFDGSGALSDAFAEDLMRI